MPGSTSSAEPTTTASTTEPGDGSEAGEPPMGDPACAMMEPACQDLCNMVCTACGDFPLQDSQCTNFQGGELSEHTCLSCKSQIAMWATTCENMSEAALPDSDPAACPDDVARGPECQALYACCLEVPPEQAPACENIANGDNETAFQTAAQVQYCG